jgi:hypothetical protein
MVELVVDRSHTYEVMNGKMIAYRHNFPIPFPALLCAVSIEVSQGPQRCQNGTPVDTDTEDLVYAPCTISWMCQGNEVVPAGPIGVHHLTLIRTKFYSSSWSWSWSHRIIFLSLLHDSLMGTALARFLGDVEVLTIIIEQYLYSYPEPTIVSSCFFLFMAFGCFPRLAYCLSTGRS